MSYASPERRDEVLPGTGHRTGSAQGVTFSDPWGFLPAPGCYAGFQTSGSWNSILDLRMACAFYPVFLSLQMKKIVLLEKIT
jgi:hypothetical protein